MAGHGCCLLREFYVYYCLRATLELKLFMIILESEYYYLKC